MLHQSAIEGYFAQQEDLLVEAVSRLVRIDSTLGPAQPGQPFGPGPAAALEAFLSLAQEWGLPGENLSGYVGTVDLNNQPDTALHILGHLDIVDAEKGWTVTAPFQPKVVDGLLYGRGTADDKGPMVAALLAMKAIRDLKLPLTKNVRLIAGTDEETGFRDIKWYYGSHPYAPHTLSPDADFPIINLEKGHYQPTFQAAWPQETALPRVAAFSGGTRLNMVPPKPRLPSWASPPARWRRPSRPWPWRGRSPVPAPRRERPSTWPAPGRTPTAPPPRRGTTPRPPWWRCWPPCPWQTAPLPGPSGPSTPSSPTGTTGAPPWASPRRTTCPAP